MNLLDRAIEERLVYASPDGSVPVPSISEDIIGVIGDIHQLPGFSPQSSMQIFGPDQVSPLSDEKVMTLLNSENVTGAYIVHDLLVIERSWNKCYIGLFIEGRDPYTSNKVDEYECNNTIIRPNDIYTYSYYSVNSDYYICGSLLNGLIFKYKVSKKQKDELYDKLSKIDGPIEIEGKSSPFNLSRMSDDNSYPERVREDLYADHEFLVEGGIKKILKKNSKLNPKVLGKEVESFSRFLEIIEG